MKKQIVVSFLAASLAFGYQPDAPPPVFLFSQKELRPTEVLWPAVIAVAVGGGVIIWGGIKIFNKIQDIREHQLTNAPVDQIVFTLEDEYPE